MQLPNQEKIRTFGKKETYKYLGILEADAIKQVEMKEKNFKSVSQKTWKLLETKLYCRHFVKDKNTWAVSFIRYFKSGLEKNLNNWIREQEN